MTRPDFDRRRAIQFGIKWITCTCGNITKIDSPCWYCPKPESLTPIPLVSMGGDDWNWKSKASKYRMRKLERGEE
jgi:hypothetical protein